LCCLSSPSIAEVAVDLVDRAAAHQQRLMATAPGQCARKRLSPAPSLCGHERPRRRAPRSVLEAWSSDLDIAPLVEKPARRENHPRASWKTRVSSPASPHMSTYDAVAQLHGVQTRVSRRRGKARCSPAAVIAHTVTSPVRRFITRPRRHQHHPRSGHFRQVKPGALQFPLAHGHLQVAGDGPARSAKISLPFVPPEPDAERPPHHARPSDSRAPCSGLCSSSAVWS